MSSIRSYVFDFTRHPITKRLPMWWAGHGLLVASNMTNTRSFLSKTLPLLVLVILTFPLWAKLFPKKQDGLQNQNKETLVRLIAESGKGDFIVLTNGQVIAVVAVLDRNNILGTTGRESWERVGIEHLAMRTRAVVREAAASPALKRIFFNQTVGRTNAQVAPGL